MFVVLYKIFGLGLNSGNWKITYHLFHYADFTFTTGFEWFILVFLKRHYDKYLKLIWTAYYNKKLETIAHLHILRKYFLKSFPEICNCTGQTKKSGKLSNFLVLITSTGPFKSVGSIPWVFVMLYGTQQHFLAKIL